MTMEQRALTPKVQLHNLGLKNIVLHKPRYDINGTIKIIRSLLPRCYFNKETTKEGYECLKQYRRKYNEEMGVYSSKPLHNWASNGADAFSILETVENRATRALKRSIKKKSGGTKAWSGLR